MALAVGWPPFLSYEWVRDIGVPVLSAIATISVGLVAVFVARRSNRIAEDTTNFARTVQAAEEGRVTREEQRRRQQERVEFAVFAREYADLHARRVLGHDTETIGSESNDFELRISQEVTTLTDHEEGKYLLERIRDVFGAGKFPVDGTPRHSGIPLEAEVRMTLQVVRMDIAAYVEHRPLTKPHWRERSTVNPNQPQ